MFMDSRARDPSNRTAVDDVDNLIPFVAILAVGAEVGRNNERHRLALRGLLQHLGRDLIGVSPMYEDIGDI